MKVEKTSLSDSLKKRVYAEFSRHAIQSTGIDGLDAKPVVFEMKNNKNEWIGCVVVQLFWGQLHIKYLVVAESYRKKGLGQELMEHAFAYGRQQECQFAFAETMNFQAVEFYQKLGFNIELVRHGYACGTSFCYLKKIL